MESVINVINLPPSESLSPLHTYDHHKVTNKNTEPRYSHFLLAETFEMRYIRLALIEKYSSITLSALILHLKPKMRSVET